MTKKKSSKTKGRQLGAEPSVVVLTKAQTPEVVGAPAPRRVIPQRSLPAPLPPSPCECEDRDPSAAFAETYDRFFHANLARFTSGLSPAALMQAYFDWCIHLATAPGKQMQLVYKPKSGG
jgi:polyhydroxyalkanoate synthase